jgi:hypothetical protein
MRKPLQQRKGVLGLATAFRRGLTVSAIALPEYSLLKAGSLDRSMKTATSSLTP